MLGNRFRNVSLAAWLVLSLLAGAPARAAGQGPLTARALVEKNRVFLGEPFLLQIRVDGSDSPAKPDLGGLSDFTVEDLGGQQNSSQSVTIINGRVNRVIQHGYIFSYRLTAKKTGLLKIPAIAVSAGGRTALTQPLTIQVTAPAETKDFKLRVSLSEQKAYVGQPVLMTVTWYIGKNVRDFSFTVPVLTDRRFQVADLPARFDPNQDLRIPIGNAQVVARKGHEELDGRQYLTVRFRKVLIPKQAGSFTLPRATVAGKALEGYRRGQRRSLFDDFFDDNFFNDQFFRDNFFNNDLFGFGRQPVYESFVVPSNRPALRVLELPAAGRPPGFSGLVGRFRITASATPTKVTVGDPITLTLRVSGPAYLGNVDLPPLADQPALAQDFKIPAERAAGVIEGNAKKFTQTIRARHAGVREIPPIALSYFDPKTGSYQIARTKPIPLTVKGTRVLRASDAEGRGEAARKPSSIESNKGGIAYNYGGPDVLVNQAFGLSAWLASPGWIAALGLPPLVYFTVLGFIGFTRWRERDPQGRRARRAYRTYAKAVSSLRAADTDEYYAALLEALRRYLGDKFGLPPGALTFADVRPLLEQRGVSAQSIDAVGRLFERCEAGRYAGPALSGQTPAELAEAAKETIKNLEQMLS